MQNKQTNSGVITPLVYAAWVLILMYYCAISYAVFPSFPTNFDEYGYYNQAKLFTEGKLVEEKDRFHHSLMEPHVRNEGNRYYSKYPPGYISVLAAFMALGLDKAANPVIMTASFAVMYLILTMFLGRISSLLIIIAAATTPYATGYGVSFFSQPLSLLLTTSIVLCFLKYQQTERKLTFQMLAVCLTLLMVTRPIDALVIAISVSLCVLVIFKRKRLFFHAGTIFLGLLGGYVLLSVYYSLLKGDLTLITYASYQSYQQGTIEPAASSFVGKLIALMQDYSANLSKHLGVLFSIYFLPLVGYVPLLLSAIGLVFVFSKKQHVLVFLHLLLFVAIMNLFPNLGWPAYGARYWFAVYGCFVVLCAFGWWCITTLCKNKLLKQYVLPAIGLLLLFVQLGFNLVKGIDTAYAYQERFTLMKNAQTNLLDACPKRSLVMLLNRNEATIRGRVPYVHDNLLKQNTFEKRGRLILNYADNPDIKHIKQIQKKYPGYSICPHQPDYFEYLKNQRKTYFSFSFK